MRHMLTNALHSRGTCGIMRHMTTSTTDWLIGAEEAAARLGISRNGVQSRVRDGRLRPAAVVGKRGVLVFFATEIDRIAALEGVRYSA